MIKPVTGRAVHRCRCRRRHQHRWRRQWHTTDRAWLHRLITKWAKNPVISKLFGRLCTCSSAILQFTQLALKVIKPNYLIWTVWFLPYSICYGTPFNFNLWMYDVSSYLCFVYFRRRLTYENWTSRENLDVCHRLRWLFPIRLQLSGVLHINNKVIFKTSHMYQILLPFVFLRIFVPKFEKCCQNSHWELCDLYTNLAIKR